MRRTKAYLTVFRLMKEKELIQSSLNGDKKSLESLIHSVQGLVFNLSIRFLWSRDDAEDATQEIMIRVITNLSKFDGRSKFSTWVYRVATNYLLDLKRTNAEKSVTSFEAFGESLLQLHGPVDYNLPDRKLMEEELKTGCTLAMLQCMDRDLRVAFILGSVMKIRSTTAAEIAETTPENFRKRLEKARRLIRSFLDGHCGVFNPQNKCRCSNRINSALACGLINKKKLNFVGQVDKFNEEMEEIHSLEGIFHNHGRFRSSRDIIAQVNEILATKEVVNYNSTKPLAED